MLRHELLSLGSQCNVCEYDIAFSIKQKMGKSEVDT